MGTDPATAPRNDGPGNEAYRRMRGMLAAVTQDEMRRR